MKSYQQPPSGTAAGAKKSGMKERHSPYDPYREKARGKETRRGSLQNPSKIARARACTCTYAEAGAAADEIVGNCFPALADHIGFLALKCRHGNATLIVEKAYECASRERQGEIRNGIGVFLAWVDRRYPKGGAR